MTDRTTRRDFLRATTTVLGGLVAGGGLAACGGAAARRETDTAASADAVPGRASLPVGVQLYTVRDLMQKDVDATLAAVAAIGYRELEFAGYFGKEPARLRETLDRLGLTAPSVHVPIEQMRTNLSGIMDAAQVLGHQWVVVPWLAEADRTLASYRRLADEFDTWGARLRERGMRFAYHNHEFEFAPIDGAVPFDLLLAETDPANVAYELDIFWATHAGRDPVTYFQRHPGRFPLWHVKDMRGIGGAKEMVSVGEGDIDFRRIFDHAAQAGLRHAFVEHDNPADPLASLRTSFQTVQRLVG